MKQAKPGVALVTGAGGGIGRAVCLKLFADGYAVVLAGRRREPLDETVELAAADPARALAVPTDIGRPEQLTELFARLEQKFGRLDLLFNNAGTFTPGVPMEELSYEQWQATVDVNLTGPFLCARPERGGHRRRGRVAPARLGRGSRERACVRRPRRFRQADKWSPGWVYFAA